MKNTFFTVGPSAIYPNVPKWTEDYFKEGLASVSHRSQDFEKMYKFLDEQLRKLMHIPESHFIFIGNSGSEIMERIFQNCVSKNSFHFVNGSFSDKFYRYANRFELSTEKYEVAYGKGFDEIPKINDKSELICITHNETSTGIKASEDYIHQVKSKNPDKILAVDIVSSAPMVNLNFSLVDTCFFSSQKAFGMPSGLGIWIIRKDLADNLAERAFYKGKGAHNILADYLKNYEKFQTPSTPNTLGVYLMGKIAEDMNTKGRTVLMEEMKAKKKLFHSILNNNPYLTLKNDDEHCSDTVIVAEYLQDKHIVDSLLKDHNIICSSGHGMFKETQLRFANFPANTIQSIEYLSKILKTQ